MEVARGDRGAEKRQEQAAAGQRGHLIVQKKKTHQHGAKFF